MTKAFASGFPDASKTRPRISPPGFRVMSPKLDLHRPIDRLLLTDVHPVGVEHIDDHPMFVAVGQAEGPIEGQPHTPFRIAHHFGHTLDVGSTQRNAGERATGPVDEPSMGHHLGPARCERFFRFFRFFGRRLAPHRDALGGRGL